ncbi:MAG TPA: YcnI family protein [Candidatus Stackebrandtia excrementipullorum]|nr:YcnI family protein [Candidatus Stackebrandtia excrementipullorum]
MSVSVRRFGAVLAGAAVSVLMFAPAAAHVTIQPGEAGGGSYSRFDFRVPNESDTASTVRLEVHFPEESPLASVRTIDVPGWSADVETVDLDTPVEVHGRQIDEAVSQITWTADSEDDGIAPGEFAEFGVSAGPLPEEGVLVFKTIQVYSDGAESAWIDEPTEDGSEPAEPAPVLTIVPGDGGHGHGTDEGADEDESQEAATASDGGTLPTVMSIVAAGLALAALVVSVMALRKRTSS